MKEQTLYNIEDLLCKTLDEFEGKEKLGGTGELQYLDTALHATKNLYKIMDSMDGESSYGMHGGNSSYYSRRGGSYRGYSRDDGYSRDGGYSRDDGYSRYDGSYRGEGSYRRKRDSMGRFSRSGGDMVDRLKDMMHETDDPQEKEDLEKFIGGIERRG